MYSEINTVYDLAGRAYGTSNPYTGSPSYWTTTAFDALGRPTSVKFPDNSATTYSYAEQGTTVTDPSGKQRKVASDAAGRLSNVYEPDPSNGNSLTVQTSYAYTVLDKLATVTEGAQSRTYNYDGLGRLTSAALPETAGASTTFTYDSFNDVLTRTDPRSVVTTYGYDGLNRLSGITYTIPQGSGVAATASVSYTYGSNQSQFNNGRLITMTDGIGSENYTYNNMGETTQVQKVVNSSTYTTSYQYNEAVELTQITYPSGRIVLQSVDAIGRLCAVGASGSSCSGGTQYASGFGYNVAQEVTGFNYGNGVAATFGYSPDRLQLTSLNYKKGATTLFGLNYSYGAAGSNNGQVTGITDTVDNGRSATYGYDPLGRLETAATTGSTAYPQWGLQWNYDRYGNRTAQSVTAGSAPSNSTAVAAATNQMTGYTYDANGNLTNDGESTLTYDAENRVATSTGALGSGTYSYDGKGLRVEKVAGTTTTVYIFSGSKVIAEYVNGAAPSSPTREYIYSGSALLAKVEAGAISYYQADQLSDRILTDSSGSVSGQQDHFPFGEQWYAQNTTTKWAFTTYERDGESGNDYATARYYVNRVGRFSSIDLLKGYPGNPQSLDLYSYVSNDPINSVDPTGLCPANAARFNNKNDCNNAHGPVSLELTGIVDIGIPFTVFWPGGEAEFGNGYSEYLNFIVVPVAGDALFWNFPEDAPKAASNGKATNTGKLTPAQCQAARTLLAREAQSGTTIAALQSAIGFGDNTVQPFNSSNTAPIDTPVGPIKVDWYTDIQATGPSFSFGVGNSIAYAEGKLVWTGLRLASGAPITNYLPFTDAAERNTLEQTFSPFSHYSDIFTPAFMQENCK